MRMIVFVLCTAYSLLAADAKPPAQAARGQAAFLDESAPAHCGGCHALAKQGTAVGPDLSRLARLNARAIVMAIRATRTQYVQWVKLKDGKEFPGMPGAKDDTTVQFYDVSATPPVLVKLQKSDIASAGDNATWKHPPESAGYTAQQLADIIAYIKWASYGDTKAVSPADTE
ncbi:MAG: c-type cytochrome [Acidobacteriia bacterium]|nr:c-type cytochrome [Terriglobia bacterium]